MNITNDVITEYLEGFYDEQTEALRVLRAEAEEKRVPIILRDTEVLLTTLVRLKKPVKILEIGAAVGYSASYFASLDDKIKVTTIESNEDTYNIAKENIEKLGYSDRIDVYLGDAREVLENLAKKDGELDSYDLVFIDAAKSHYKAFWDLSLPLIKEDALIICDNILMKGMTASKQYDKYKRHRTNIKYMRQFLEYINNLNYAETSMLAVGDGVTLSVIDKRRI